MSLRGRHIVLGVTGGIAAYKAVELCRRLIDDGAYVSPILTHAATEFVGAATFSALASEPARTELLGGPEVSPHTHLAKSADLVVVAPATAHLLSAYATGASGDLLTATLLASRAPVMVCPAMHTEMWEHPAVQDNIATLQRRGTSIVPPAVGPLAGGDSGAGRLADVADILDAVRGFFSEQTERDLQGLRVVITAGGTREPIDPVRYLGNRSSGKQGHALAEEAAARGAEVVLVTTVERPTSSGVEVRHVETAAEMHRAVMAESPAADVVIMAAAVADFRPVQVAPSKIKKAAGPPTLTLEPTVDILREVVRTRRPGQTVVGFAAETDDVEDHAAAKLADKGVDLIVANDVSAPSVGFAHDTNEVVVLTASGERTDVPLADKRQVAVAVFDAVVRSRRSVASGPE
ncbi:MAG TPA: bifunctional phosphopantothenoylcysteine decarboxylase/phosphopantothenate--cysteine ligase CoaBC [Acidimicrobiales bacterium]|nr:bifunctional phosphopantothenoylcysteine decarboxylase/phosphopantothenate--cysteine ligase CoaBC [Acidimicrobiales bacterium]